MKRLILVCGFLTASALQAQDQTAAWSARRPLSLDGFSGGVPAVESSLFAPGAWEPGSTVSVAGVEFVLGTNVLDVARSMSGLREPVRVKPILSGVKGPGRLAATVPGGQYAGLYLLAFSRKQADAEPFVTVLLGRYNGSTGILYDERAQVPDVKASSGALTNLPVKLADGSQGYLHLVRVPLAGTANVRESGSLTMEFTRGLSVRVNLPDPNEFGLVPAGVPSGVVIVGATLELSPVTMTHTSTEAGNVFYEGQRPAFQVTVSNRTDGPVKGRVAATCEGPGTAEEGIAGRDRWSVDEPYALKPGEAKTLALGVAPPSKLRGWYSAQLVLEQDALVLQRRDTSFAVLAPDTRKAFDESPFGVWEFWGPHNSFRRPDQFEALASLMKKGGWRWTYGGSPAAVALGKRDDMGTPEFYHELFRKYGVRLTVQSLPHAYQRGEGWYDEAQFASNEVPVIRAHFERGYDNAFKVLHEARSSTTLLRRFNEFLGGEPYAMPPEEKARLDAQFENVKQYCAAIKKADPRARIVLINDYPHVAIEYLKRGMPPELFDVIGLELAGFMREPERQPDWLSVLGHAEIMRRAYAKYGYDKPIWTTEALYHGTNPGNLSLHAQGVISVRELMIVLANGFSKMAAAGLLKDSSDDYYASNWGAGGYCFRDPELNPKPAYAMVAWLTQVLDRCRFSRVVETGSTALHVLEFARPEGAKVYAVWVVRGAQKATLDVASGRPEVRDVYGNPVRAAAEGGKLQVLATDTPLYVTGTEVAGVSAREPVELTRETGAALIDFADPAELKAVAATNPVLERNWDFPRLKGDFATAYETVDGATALKVELKPDGDGRKLFQRYVEFALARPVPLEGRPEALHVRVKGNGGWGRVMFELVDAKGRIWTSCGNQYAGSCNASDNKGDSFVSFDGWQTMRIPLVRQYPGSDQWVMAPATPDWWPENAPEHGETVAAYEKAKAAYEAAMAEFPGRMAAYEVERKAYEERKQQLGKKAGAAPKAPEPPVKPGFRWTGLAGVDYPVKLTKVIVAMAPHMLYGNGERPVEHPVIWLDRVSL